MSLIVGCVSLLIGPELLEMLGYGFERKTHSFPSVSTRKD